MANASRWFRWSSHSSIAVSRAFTQMLGWFLVVQILVAPGLAHADPPGTDGSTFRNDRSTSSASFTGSGTPGNDRFSGAATYSIAIEAPPATGGLIPHVALRNRSQAASDSWVGYGWSLETSSIRRSLEKGVPTYGANGATDILTLDGQKLLADGTVPDPDGTIPGRYHTRVESFIRIIKETDGSWTVVTKDGTRRRYGISIASRIDDAAGHTFEWLLAEEQDLHGNVVTYAYDRQDPGTAYLEDIKYTLRRVAGGGLQSLDDDPSRDRVLHFELESAARPDQPVSYAAGFQRKLAHRLDYVDVSAGGQLIRRYDLGYATSEDSSRSLLTGVSVYGANAGTAGAASFTTTFQYRTNKTASYDRRGWASSPVSWSWPSAGPLVAADRTDNGVRLGDVDGDALPDLVKSYAAVQQDANHNVTAVDLSSDSGIYLNTGTGFPSSASLPIPQPTEANGLHTPAFVWDPGAGHKWPTGRLLLDLTGDGRADIAGALDATPPSTGQVVPLVGQWFTGSASGFVASNNGYDDQYMSTGRLAAGPGAEVGGGNTSFADLNGDGLPEIIVRGVDIKYVNFAGALSCYPYPGSPLVPLPFAVSYAVTNLDDFNFALPSQDSWFGGTLIAPGANNASPGCSVDVVASSEFAPCTLGVDAQCTEGIFHNAFYPTLNLAFDFWYSVGIREFGNTEVDLNGDGLADYLASYVDNAGTASPVDVSWAALNNGLKGASRDNRWKLPKWSYESKRQPGDPFYARDLGLRFADVNGDGRVDLLEAVDGIPATRSTWLTDGDVEETSSPSPWVAQAAGVWSLPASLVFANAAGQDMGVRLVDMDGDGMVDVLASIGTTHDVYLNQGQVPDLLETVTSPLGGTTRFTYAPSTAFDNDDANGDPGLPQILQVLTQIDADPDGAAGPQPPLTTTVAYKGGLYDAADREFRGFREVRETRFDRTTITRFHQDVAKAGLVESEQIVSAGNPTLCWAENHYDYLADPTEPYTSLLTSQTHIEFDGRACTTGAANTRRSRVIFWYGPNNTDPYGNLTHVYAYGQVDAAGNDSLGADTRISLRFYAPPDDTRYVVDRVIKQDLYEGPNTAQGTLLGSTRFFYDGSTSYTYGFPSTGGSPLTFGDLTRQVQALAEPGKPDPTVTYGYDGYGNVWTVQDPLGQGSNAVTTIMYDTTFHAFPIAIVNAAGHRTEFDYTRPAICALAYPAGSGAVQAMRTPNGVADGTSTRRCFDAFGRVIREAAPGGLADTVWTYDDTPGAVWVKESRLVGSTNRRDTTTYFDGLGRTIQTSAEGPQGKTIVQGRAHDAAGRLQSIAAPHFSGDPAQASTFAYDPLDRLTQEVLPGSGRTWTTSYDRGLVTITDPNTNPVEQQSSPFGDIVSVSEHNGAATYSTQFAYRGDGQLRSVTDARSNVTIVGYDLLGRKRSLEDPDSGTTTYDYDANGNLTKRTDSAGVTDWTYDAINRPRTRKLGGIQDVTWNYDTATHGIGLLFEQVDAAGTYRAPAYDTMGRVSSETYLRGGRSFGFTTVYDGLGQIDRRVFPNGKFIDFNQDAQGYVTATASGSAAAVSGVEWDARGRLKKWTAGNGVAQTTGFDPATGRLSGIEVKPTAGTAIDSHTYTFDPGDRLTRIDEQQPTTQPRVFGYDALNRLISATGPYPNNGTTLRYGYDSIGNLTCKDAANLTGCAGSQAVAASFPASAAPRPHAPLSVNGATAGYGSTGNLQTLGARSYGYDVLGQLKTVRDGGKLLATYGYDAAGSRAKVTDTAGPRPSLVRHLIRPDFEWDATRALAKVYLDLAGTRVATATDAYTPPAGAATPLAAPLSRPWTRTLGGAPIAAAALLLLLQLAQRRRQRLPLARPALAGTVVVALLTSWAQPALASLPDGDLNADGRLDAADVLLAQRMASGTLAQHAVDVAHGDVAPLAGGDAQISPGDVVVLLRGIRGEDVDGDGVALATELAQGSSAFRADSDGDGWSDAAELAAGTDPVAADTDDDGFPDPSDASPRNGVLYTHVDHQGSVTLATRSDGAIAYRTDYAPFGEASLPAGGYAAPNPFGYTGQRYEVAPALYDYGARFYDPQLGRFLQPDSIVPDPYTPQSLNRYSYVLNSPPNWTDPSGNTPVYPDYGYSEGGAGSPGPDWEAQLRGAQSDWRPPAEPLWDRAIQWSSGGSRRSHRDRANSAAPGEIFKLIFTGSGPIGSAQGQRPSITVPNSPRGVSVDVNILETRRLSRLDPEAALIDWVNKVREGGQWDYKRLEPVGVYEEFGNFNYGATGRALGLPREVLLRAAGFVQVLESLRTGRPHGPGTPSGNPPYGDFPEDQGPILRGTEYYDRNFWGRRLDVR